MISFIVCKKDKHKKDNICCNMEVGAHIWEIKDSKTSISFLSYILLITLKGSATKGVCVMCDIDIHY